MTPQFQPGNKVKVDTREQSGHVRTPYYIRGRTGTVIEVVGAYANPELLAEGTLGLPYRVLYRVRFEQCELWPRYDGSRIDKVFVDIFEHWLSPA